MDPELENAYYLNIGNTLKTFVQRAIKDGNIEIVEYDADCFFVFLNNQLVASLKVSGYGSGEFKLYIPVFTEYLKLLEPIDHLFNTVYTLGLPDDYFNKLPKVIMLVTDTIATSRERWIQVYIRALKEITTKYHLPAELNPLIRGYLICV